MHVDSAEAELSGVGASTGQSGDVYRLRAYLSRVASSPSDTEQSPVYLGNLPRTRDVSLVYCTMKRDDAIVVEWLGESKYSADDLLAASHNADAHSQLQEACYVLYSILFSKGTPVPASEVSEAAGDALVSIGTLKRAKRMLKVRSRRESLNISVRGADGKTEFQAKMGWTWELPHDDERLAPYKERFEREEAEYK